MNANQTEVTETLRRLNALAEQTREQLRELLRMVPSDALTMTHSQLFHADEAIGKVAHLDRKHAKEISRG